MVEPTASEFAYNLPGLRCTVCLLLVLNLVPLKAYGIDATGLMRFASCNYVNQYRLTLTRYEKHNLEKPVVLELPGDWALTHLTKDWCDVSGTECSGDGRCETVAAKIQGVRIHGWRGMSAISGNFVIERKDGKKLQGSFKAKYLKPAARIICE